MNEIEKTNGTHVHTVQILILSLGLGWIAGDKGKKVVFTEISCRKKGGNKCYLLLVCGASSIKDHDV